MSDEDRRRYLPTIAELIDKLSILTLKEILDPEHKERWREEKKDVLHDLDFASAFKMDAKVVHAIVVLAQTNVYIWRNEVAARRGLSRERWWSDLRFTHGLNGIRHTAKNVISKMFGERVDHKIDCPAADFKDWEIEW